MTTATRVLIDAPAWFVRSRNTDWRYMRGLARLSEHVAVEPRLMRGSRDAVEESWAYLAARATGGPARLERRVPGDDLRRSGAQVVLSHRRFPRFAQPVPVIWRHAVLDPRMSAGRGHGPEHVEAEYLRQRPLYEAAAVVQVSTRAEALRHATRFPDLADRFAYCPFFMPDLTAMAADRAIEKHRGDGRLRLLFVGHQARREGLPLLLAAVAALPEAAGNSVELDVVSSLNDGAVAFPIGLTVRNHGAAAPVQVRALMAAAHVVAMPSRFESYGFVLVEAMAQGCAVIGPDFEVQTELLSGAGVTVDTTVPAPAISALRQALLDLIDKPERRRDLALAAIARVEAELLPAVVARRYLDLITRAQGTRR